VQLGDEESAAKCFMLNYQRSAREDSGEMSEAQLYLAKYFKSQGRFEEALQFARNLYAGSEGGPENKEAFQLVRELSSQLANQQ